MNNLSDRNRNDYFDLDNFDESIDSREYRRRTPDRRNAYNSYNGRSSYNRRGPKKSGIKTRTRNRIIIVAVGVIIVALLVTLFVLLFSQCGKPKDTSNISTEVTKSAYNNNDQTSQASAAENPGNNNAGGDKLSINTYNRAKPEDNNTDGYMDNYLYVWNSKAFELFGGDDMTAERYADIVNTLAGKLSGMNVYSMVIPNHTEMGLPDRLIAGGDDDSSGKAYTNSQADNIKAAYNKMDQTKVTPVNAYNYLSEHCNEYIYFDSDHHWTGLGSYYAYKAFVESQGLEALSLDTCTEMTIGGFTGTLSQMTSGIKEDTVHYWQFPYTVTMDITDANGNVTNYDDPYFDEEASGTLTYGTFIYGDNPLTVLHSSSENAQQGKKIAVVKESYGNAFVPYLSYNYEEVHVVDLRTFRNVSSGDLAAYCRQNGITDVLFLNGIMSANTPERLDEMTTLCD